MRYFIIEGKKIGISKSWTKGVIWFFLAIVILGYITTVYLLGKVSSLLIFFLTSTEGLPLNFATLRDRHSFPISSPT